MKHEEVEELLVGHALGTLEPDEEATVEAHLAEGCDDCEGALRELTELTARLSYSVPQAEVSPSVKERLMASVAGQKPKAASGSQRIWRMGWAAAGIAALIAVVIGLVALSLQEENRRVRRELAEASDITALLGAPGMQFVSLEGIEPNGQAFGKVVLDPDLGAGVVYMYRLPQTPEGMEYQLWVMREGKPTSAGVFTVTENGSAMLRMDELADPTGIASFQVTIESEGGEISPTGMMYLTGPVLH